MTQEAKVLLGIGAATLVILIGAALLFTRTAQAPSSSPLPSVQLLIRPDSHQTASSSAQAKVTVVEFGDYQCPACGAAYPVTKQILQNYGPKINFVFRNFPLPQHQYAALAAEAAEAAGAQGKFWEMHDKLYETQNDWASSTGPLNLFVGYAKDLGLNTQQFQADIQSNKYQAKIQQDINDGNALGINETPTFFVKNTEFPGVPTYDQLKSLIDSSSN